MDAWSLMRGALHIFCIRQPTSQHPVGSSLVIPKSPQPADTSNYQSWTSDHFPAPADTSNYQFCTSNYQSWTSDHFPAPADTSPKSATIFLHQRKPVLHQRPPIQRIPVLYQLSRPAPATRSYFNDRHPGAAIIRRTLFRFTIRHNKVSPFEATPLFCHSCLVRCQSLIFQKFAETSIFIWPPQQVYECFWWLISEKKTLEIYL